MLLKGSSLKIYFLENKTTPVDSVPLSLQKGMQDLSHISSTVPFTAVLMKGK